ncbi:MAG: helix-turn-helix domain-containing protein [Prosthecobacter sp.]|nr:helix-turn-helix domain-containing protein [Prosthecobacter sp.]
MNTHDTHSSAHQRFIANLADSELFQHYQRAFRTLTGLMLSLDPCTDVEQSTTTQDIRGLVTTLVPVRIGKNVVAALHTGGTRLHPVRPESFNEVAKAMLEDDHSAAEIRAAKVEFEALPAMAPERYEAAVALLGSFALQMGESAHRFLFAHASNEPEAVRRAKEYIHTHLAEAMTLESVAKAVGVSPFHFCKIFKHATGLTFTDFVSHARVEKAKRLLMKPAARITDVAYDVGFQSLSHFNRSFRRIVSESPTEFRSRIRSTVASAHRQTRPLAA